MKLPRHWSLDGVDARKLSEHVVANADQWDREDWRRLRKEITELGAATNALREMAETGGPFMADAFWSLFKVAPRAAQPEDVKPSHLVNLTVWEESQHLNSWQELRRFTRGDDVASAMACVDLEPDFETLFDREKQRAEEAANLETQLQALYDALSEQADLDAMMASLDEPNPSLVEQAEALQALIDRLRDQTEQMAQELADALGLDATAMMAMLDEALSRAAEQARELSQAAELWGVDPGLLMHLDVNERMELARKLDSDRIRRIMELFGPMRELMWAVRRRKVHRRHDMVHRVTTGRDLTKVLPSEIVKLRHPVRRKEFYRDYAERRLLIYEMTGTEKVGRGGIVFCEDGSGSMGGDPEMWAKAVGLNLLHLSRKQRRAFHAIHFGSRNEVAEISFEHPDDYTIERTMEFTSLFFGGGTDFETPLNRAVAKLELEYRLHGQIEGDIVFITDGICGVSDKWMADFKAKQKQMQFSVWGIFVGRNWMPEPLTEICDGQVCTVKDFVTGGDVKKVFAGV